MPLNRTLYQLLRREFGEVNIVHEGDAMAKTYERDYSVFPPRIRLRPLPHGAGEYYRVNCCFCNDTRGRLYINHMWGVPDEVTHEKNLWLACCYNEDCLSDYDQVMELYNRVYGFRNANLRNQTIEIAQGNLPNAVLEEVKLPGECISLTELPANHAVINYLHGRNYDPAELVEKYNVMYCVQAKPEWKCATGRIVIPIIMRGELVGWQCRFPEDMSKEEWKRRRIPKYYNLPGMPKRLMLYNYDITINLPYCVVCEGVTSAWAFGDHGVAIFGKSLSSKQAELLAKGWKAVAIVMDGDEKGRAASEEIYIDLRPHVPCFQVTIPDDRDPGESDSEWLWCLVHAAAKKAGINLDTLRGRVNHASERSATRS